MSMVRSKIKDILNDNESILVFDVDGVLSLLEFGEYNHYIYDDETWDKENKNGYNFYNENLVVKKMQKYLASKDMKRIYVVTTVGSNNEGEFKKDFVNKYYNILNENVYFVDKNRDKTKALFKIKDKYPNIEDRKLVMIDDTVDILNDIMEKTNFSTAHISSFLDI